MTELIVPRIEAAERLMVRIPLVSPFETSFSVQTDREALLIRLRAQGESGWGECVAGSDPFYSYETNGTAAPIIRDYLLPLVQESAGLPLIALLHRFDRVRGHRMAKATLENALLDLIAKIDGKPLWQLLGGEKKPVFSGISLGIQKDRQLFLDTIEKAVRRRYGRVKMKIKKGHDIEAVAAVRDRFPDLPLMADANSDYTLADLSVLRELDRFHLMMIEQPLSSEDIYFHSRLQRELSTPVCLDESIHSLGDVRAAIELGACRIINIKQGRVGGLLAAREIQEYCRGQRIPVWSGGMLETGIGRAVNIHLQTLPGFTLPGDTSETSRYFHEEITEPPVVLDANGLIAIPPGPGIGVEVVEKQISRFRTVSEKIFP